MHIFSYTCTAKLELIRKFLLIDLNNATPIVRDSSFIKQLKSMCVIILVFSNIKILFPYILLFQEKMSYLVLLTETLKVNQVYNVLLVRMITAVFFHCWGTKVHYTNNKNGDLYQLMLLETASFKSKRSQSLVQLCNHFWNVLMNYFK